MKSSISILQKKMLGAACAASGIMMLLFGDAVQANQLLLQPTVISSSSHYSIRTPENTGNGLGLVAGASGIVGEADSLAGNNPDHMWTTSPGDANPYVTYDLGGACDLKITRLWNYNEAGFSSVAPSNILLSTSIDGTNFIPLTNIYPAQPHGSPSEGAQDFATVASGIRYVQMQILTGWEGDIFWSSITGASSTGVDGRYLTGLSAARFVVETTAPILKQQPQQQTVQPGSDVTFSVSASDSGFPPLTYHWRKNGTNLTDGGDISGVTTTNLVISNVSLRDGGNYDVMVANTSASITSRAAALLMAVPSPAQWQQRLDTEFNPKAIRLAVKDLAALYPDRFHPPAGFEAKLAGYEQRLPGLKAALGTGSPESVALCKEMLAFQRSVLLSNPLLDFDKLLVIRRSFPGNRAREVISDDVGFTTYNFVTQTDVPRHQWDNQICLLSNLQGTPKFKPLYKPAIGQIVRDLNLDFDASRLLFASRGASGRWAVYQINANGTDLQQISPTEFPDLDFFGPCYLPNGKIIVDSTASYSGLPCMGGDSPTANLFLLDPDSKQLRQLTFDQDSDIHPTVMGDGRVLYLRWEYSDIPHYFSRRLFTMNPDGTGQLAYYGSGSLFPTTFLFPKPIPGHSSEVVGVLGGHHDVSESGRMALIDPALGTQYPFRYRPTSKEWAKEGSIMNIVPDLLPADKTGFVQLIPGYGKPVPAQVCDGAHTVAYGKEFPSLTTHPFPLSDKYFLVAMKPAPQGLWGIYLVDIFDNQTLIAETEGAALLEPVPLLVRQIPPIIPERIEPKSKTASVHIADIYIGAGLRGVPRGTVKSLRVFSYHYAYNKRAGHDIVGVQSSWDVKRVLGTASVEADGSAHFEIPANLPVSIQPLDSEGRAVQLMRSWLVGMSGENVSCTGCHENRSTSLPVNLGLAGRRPAEELKPWFGSPRPFAFSYEVYPVLEKYCVGCHDKPTQIGPRSHPSFADPDTAYASLHPYVHRPGPESDMAVPNPMEYHASTSPLIQMLEKGHHGRKIADLDRESRERLYTWIDLNAPRKGTWDPVVFNNYHQDERRQKLSSKFANIEVNPEAEYRAALEAFNKRTPAKFIPPALEKPMPADELKCQAAPAATGSSKVLDLGNNVQMKFVRIPAGTFVMGSLDGYADEQPRSLTRVVTPFWMSVTEVSNGQFAQFDPDHDTRYIDMHGKDHPIPGHIANHPDQPVSRVSWQEAMNFCHWLGKKTELKVSLPTEAQWEWAARSGSERRFFFGDLDSDFGRFANLADQSLRWMATSWQGGSTLQVRQPYAPEANFPLHEERFRDNWYVVDYVGQTQPNPWGLQDMIGNVNEWTRSNYQPYPYREEDGRNDGSISSRKVARGGSWADRPVNAGASVRRDYESWQKVYDVGFRVIIEEDKSSRAR